MPRNEGNVATEVEIETVAELRERLMREAIAMILEELGKNEKT